ncbi:MAG: 6-pyruvoyl tetrahydropterin synthase family protein [Methanomassiliicoccales archaeon]
MAGARLEINGWETGIKFTAAHFLPAIEKCSRLHGHNYAVSIRIEGERGEEGIVVDFTIIRDALRDFTKALDHKLLLPERAKDMVINKRGDSVEVEFNGKHYAFPSVDIAFIPIEHTSAEEIAEFLCEKVVRASLLGERVKSLSVGVAEGRGQEAWVERILH